MQLCKHVTWDLHNATWLEMALDIKDDHAIMHKIGNSYWVFCGTCKKLYGNEPKCDHCKTILMCPNMKQPPKWESTDDNDLLKRLEVYRGNWEKAVNYTYPGGKPQKSEQT